MPRKRINKKPLSNAEKQRRYREKQKAKIEALKAAAVTDTADVPATAPDMGEYMEVWRKQTREQIKQELIKSWEPEAKKERMREARKQARQTALQADVNFDHGRIFGILQTANYFIGKDRADITKALLAWYSIDRETAERILQDDKRTKSMTLASLDKAGAWKNPPPLNKPIK